MVLLHLKFQPMAICFVLGAHTTNLVFYRVRSYLYRKCVHSMLIKFLPQKIYVILQFRSLMPPPCTALFQTIQSGKSFKGRDRFLKAIRKGLSSEKHRSICQSMTLNHQGRRSQGICHLRRNWNETNGLWLLPWAVEDSDLVKQPHLSWSGSHKNSDGVGERGGGRFGAARTIQRTPWVLRVVPSSCELSIEPTRNPCNRLAPGYRGTLKAVAARVPNYTYHFLAGP